MTMDSCPDTLGGDPVTSLHAVVAQALADELVLINASLSELAYDLGSDPDTLRRHMASLQMIDRITQSQLGIVDILRSDAPIGARLAGVTLEDMAQRLRDRIIGTC